MQARSGQDDDTSSRPSRIGVFGGTFDPPHVGHLVTAVNVRHALDLDVVILMVANVPWQKEGTRRITPAEDRLAMVAAAVEQVDGLRPGRHELDLGGNSYTADTLRVLAEEHPGAELYTIVGDDAAAGLPTWERADEVVERSRLVVVDRPGDPVELPADIDWIRVEVPRLDVSSTDLRARVADGRPLVYLVTTPVLGVIAERRLYAADAEIGVVGVTADPKRRRRASRVGILALVASVVIVGVLSVVAVATLRSSQEGTEVVPDQRPEQRFPSTPAAMVGVVDGDRLTSVVVAVLDPTGQGGSIVTVPVNVDTSSGFGAERTPLARRSFSTDDADPLADELGLLLAVEPTFAEIVDADRLAELLAVEGDVTVSLDRDVVDAVDGDAETVVESGDRLLDAEEVVAVLTAVPPEGPAIEAHPIDVAAWTGLAESWSLTNEPIDVARDEAGVPADPATVDELFRRLRAGRVGVRDLALDPSAGVTLDNPTDADYVAIDTRDSILVFASVAPGLVLTPNPTLTFSIVAPFNRSQLATVGEGVTAEQLVRDLVGQLIFIEANVVFVDLSPAEAGAPTETVVVVDEEEFADTATVPTLIGPSTTQIAARDTDGSDVTLLLGTDFLDHRAELIAEREAERGDDDGSADFDVSGPDDGSGESASSDDDTNDGDTTGAEDADDTGAGDDEGGGADTVDGDG